MPIEQHQYLRELNFDLLRRFWTFDARVGEYKARCGTGENRNGITNSQKQGHCFEAGFKIGLPLASVPILRISEFRIGRQF